MATIGAALDFMIELDRKYKKLNIDWGKLPHDHPDIVKLQELNPIASQPVVSRKWTEEEEAFLRDNYICMTDKELSQELGISMTAVFKKRSEMRLYKHKSMNQWKS